jgi:bifunctional non-homologous end joining protein LigD
LLLGTFGPDGTLRYEGRVGMGFSAKVEADLLARFSRMGEKVSPLAKVPQFGLRGPHWVRPELVAEVEFLVRTNDGELRHSSFKGLRLDAAPSAVSAEGGRV